MQDRILLLAKNAQERFVEFLYDMEKRTSAKDCVELPLLRQDIADYLGLTIETVSRTLSFLESCAAIKRVRGRRILLYSHSLPTNEASVHPQQHRQSGGRIQQSGHEFRQLDQQGFH
jgi:CRP/FNR family nitrogen fixation transcriptional regulator